MEHNEFVVQFKDGTRDWIDPVYDVWEGGDMIFVNNGPCTYEYTKVDVEKYVVRPYSDETTYDTI